MHISLLYELGYLHLEISWRILKYWSYRWSYVVGYTRSGTLPASGLESSTGEHSNRGRARSRSASWFGFREGWKLYCTVCTVQWLSVLSTTIDIHSFYRSILCQKNSHTHHKSHIFFFFLFFTSNALDCILSPHFSLWVQSPAGFCGFCILVTKASRILITGRWNLGCESVKCVAMHSNLQCFLWHE